jgi:hypothetical protein
MKCTVKIEKLRPNHIIKKCKIVLEKIDLSTLHQQGVIVSDSSKRICRSNCKACPQLITSSTFVSTVTGRTYSLINHSGEEINCKLQNFIYLLTCKSCHCQYVGETCIPLNKRLNIHRTSTAGCEVFIDHFSNCCKDQTFTIQVIEIFQGDGYENGKVESGMRSVRREREDWWIKTLRTVYPYGLNDQVKGKNSTSSIGSLFFPLLRYTNRPNIRKRNKSSISTHTKTPQDFFDEIKQLIRTYNQQTANLIRTKLGSLNTKTLKSIWIFTKHNDTFHNDKCIRWQEFILDIIDTKIYKPPVIKKKKTPAIFTLPIRYLNKGLDFIKIRKIIKSDDVTSLLPTCITDDEKVPSVLHKLEPPIRNKIFNYQQTVNDIDCHDLQTFGTGIEECGCSESPFIDGHHKHILTGDLSIVKNNKLRKLFMKGPNFREPKPINFQKCYDVIETAIDHCIEKMILRKKINENELIPWKNMICKKVREKIDSLKNTIKNPLIKPVLNNNEVKEYLSELHSKYVIVPIDKAANNISIICKKFYIERLLDEVGILNIPNPTYSLVTDKRASQVINDNIEYSERLGFEIDEEREKSLPSIYWLPKFHKNPIATRCIVASKLCSTKQIAQAVSSCFKVIQRQIENFHHKNQFYCQYKKFWVVQNSMQIISDLDKINKRKNAKSISTFDFATLYTKIPHDQLIETLCEAIDFAFNGGDKQYLAFNGKYAFWTKNKDTQHFSQTTLKFAVKHLISSCYFVVGNMLFLQIIGMPMGIDPAPFWANIYLYTSESRYITNLTKNNSTKENKIRAKKFHATSRYIDDLCSLNDGGEFGRSHKEIYSKEMELKEEHKGLHATYLELDISVLNRIFVYKLFDKRDGFPFSIVKMPYLSSNIPYNIFYNTILSEILRIARCSLFYTDFLIKSKELCKRMKKQGAEVIFSKTSLLRFMNNHSVTFSKYNVPFHEIVDSCYD